MLSWGRFTDMGYGAYTEWVFSMPIPWIAFQRSPPIVFQQFHGSLFSDPLPHQLLCSNSMDRFSTISAGCFSATSPPLNSLEHALLCVPVGWKRGDEEDTATLWRRRGALRTRCLEKRRRRKTRLRFGGGAVLCVPGVWKRGDEERRGYVLEEARCFA